MKQTNISCREVTCTEYLKCLVSPVFCERHFKLMLFQDIRDKVGGEPFTKRSLRKVLDKEVVAYYNRHFGKGSFRRGRLIRKAWTLFDYERLIRRIQWLCKKGVIERLSKYSYRIKKEFVSKDSLNCLDDLY